MQEENNQVHKQVPNTVDQLLRKNSALALKPALVPDTGFSARNGFNDETVLVTETPKLLFARKRCQRHRISLM